MKKYLEYNDEQSSKFWKIEMKGLTHFVTYGKIGTNGQQKTKVFDQEEEATNAAEKLIAAKLKKGYQEVVDTTTALKISFLKEEEAIERFNLAEYDLLGSWSHEAILLIDGDVFLEETLSDSTISTAFFNGEKELKQALIIINGNLTIDGDLSIYGETGYPSLLILGALRCDSLYSYDNFMYIEGDAYIKYLYSGSYNHGAIKITGTLQVPYLINSDHHSDLNPSEETILINKRNNSDDFFIYDYYPEDFKRVLIEGVFYEDEEVFELDLDAFLAVLKVGNSPFKEGALPKREQAVKELGVMAQENKIKELNLTEAKLLHFPPALFEIQSLERLILDSTHCSTIETLGQLNNLKKTTPQKTIVELLYEADFSLPETLGQLTNLKELSLKKTKIKQLPTSIKQLKKLEVLNLSYCYQLTTLPESIGQLKELEILNLAQCYQLIALPESIGQLTKLKKLVLWGFKGTVPDSIFDLPQIEELEILL
ncbi:MAG: WGR domain-containing protein [Aureispira sp.]